MNAIAKAVKTLSEAMENDPDYAHGWHCNLAVCAQDAGATYDQGNDTASRFMKLAFGVTTSNEVAEGHNAGRNQ